MNDVARIAAMLNKSERAALISEPWSMMAQYEAGILEPLRLGLLEPDAYGHRRSHLGLAVANHLKGIEQ